MVFLNINILQSVLKNFGMSVSRIAKQDSVNTCGPCVDNCGCMHCVMWETELVSTVFIAKPLVLAFCSHVTYKELLNVLYI